MFIRFASATAAGIGMTLSLLYVMQSLIHLQDVDIADQRERHVFPFVRVKIREDLHTIEASLPERKELTNIEPEPQTELNPYTGPTITVHRRPPPKPPGPKFGNKGFNHDGPLVAVIRVQPAYPVRATEQGLEGFVTVQFDVNPDGTVSNIFVVESSHRLFERSAIKAAERFRFKARVVDGVPIASAGIQNRFVFELEQP